MQMVYDTEVQADGRTFWVRVLRPGSGSDELLAEFNRLCMQDSRFSGELSMDDFRQLQYTLNTHVYMLMDGERVLGICCVSYVRSLQGLRVQIEQFVIDEQCPWDAALALQQFMEDNVPDGTNCLEGRTDIGMIGDRYIQDGFAQHPDRVYRKPMQVPVNA